jgi:hypothetical protein
MPVGVPPPKPFVLYDEHDIGAVLDRLEVQLLYDASDLVTAVADDDVVV